MAKPQPAGSSKRPAPRLYLVTPVIEDAAAFAGVLRDAIAAADVAAVLLRLKPAGERDLINRIKMLGADRAEPRTPRWCSTARPRSRPAPAPTARI